MKTVGCETRKSTRTTTWVRLRDPPRGSKKWKPEIYNLHKKSIQPHESILCWSAFGSDYSFESTWVCLFQLCTSEFGDFLPFFLVDLLKLCQVGWGASVNSDLQVFPQILNRFKSGLWLGHSRTFPFHFLKPFQCYLGCMLVFIVML